MPTWATVLITVVTALISGALGAVGATWWQTRHEGREAWRSRLIDAAQTFAANAVTAYRASQEALKPPHSQASLGRLRDAFDEVRTAAYRIDLLFGLESDTRSEAWAFVDAIDDVGICLRRNPPDVAEAKKLDLTAYLARHAFSKAAHDAIRALRMP
jgi:hypothetical protein